MAILVTLALVSCSGSSSNSGKKTTIKVGNDKISMTEFKDKDFSFTYPSDWTVATNGGEIDGFGGKGVISVNNLDKVNYWVKPIVRSELIHDGGGLVVNKLPEDGVYMFVMDAGDIGKASKSKLTSSTKPYGNPEIFKNSSFKITSDLSKFPKKQRAKILKKWSVKNNWLHYRVEFINHGHAFDAHIYLLGNAVKSEQKTAGAIVKSFKLVSPK